MTGSSPRVAMVYPHLPHYRYGVFKSLDTQLDALTFIASDQSTDGIATTPPGSFTREVRVENVRVGRALWQRGLGRALRRARPDVVVFLGDASYLSTWVHAAWNRLRGRRVYFWTIGWHRPESGLRRHVRLAFYRLADGLLLYGNHGREIGVQVGFPADRMHVIYNSGASRTVEAAQRLDLDKLPDGSRPVIGAVIRLSGNKGLDVLVRAAASLRDDFGTEVDCLVVGEGPERQRLTDLAQELGVRIFLPGAVYHAEDLAAVYRRLTLTVVPRAAGLTVLQSLAAGTPVVTVADPFEQMPEFEAIEDGVTGTLIREASPECVAEASNEWFDRLDNQGDDVEEGCRAVVRGKWSPEAQAKAIIAVVRGDASSTS